mgnify:CR=1 FL=1
MLHHFYLIEFNQYYLAECEYQFEKLINVKLTTRFEYAKRFKTIDDAIKYIDKIGFGHTEEYGIIKVDDDDDDDDLECDNGKINYYKEI